MHSTEVFSRVYSEFSTLRYSFLCTNNSRLSPVRRIFRLLNLSKLCLEGTSGEPLSHESILVCSAVSKMTASIATYPHEVIRTRLQTQRRPLADDLTILGKQDLSRKGVVYVTKRMIGKEGWSALYKGLSVNLIRTVPNSVVTMLTCVFVFFVKKRLLNVAIAMRC